MNTLLLITAGRGPEEVRRFVPRLADRVAEACAARGWTVESRVSNGPADAPGSVWLLVPAADAAELSGWLGTHCWVHPQRGPRQRKRWFAGVSVATLPDRTARDVDPKDVTMCALRARGPGGQNVNKRETAVLLTHVPTGLRVRVETERTQAANRRLGLQRLAALIDAQQTARDRSTRSGVWGRHNTLERGGAVRAWTGDPIR